MPKKLLVLGAGRGQLGLIKSAKGLGYTVIVATIPSDRAVGVELADDVVYADIASPQAILEAARRIRPDGIATSCLDTGVIALGHSCDALGLPGISEAAARLCADKYQMKEAFTEAGVQTARYRRVSSERELHEAMKELQFPLIVKATDLQGSKGIYIIRTAAEAEPAFRKALSLSKKDYLILEEFIEGKEFGAQAFVYKGELLFVLPHNDETFLSGTNIPIGHSAPYCGDAGQVEAVRRSVDAAIRALGLDNCAVNVDMIERDGEIYLIELTGRVGANGLPEMTSIYFGLDYYAMIAKMAVGEDPLSVWETRLAEKQAALAEMLIEEGQGGVLEAINTEGVTSPHLFDLQFFVQPGMEVRKFQSSYDCIGQLLIKGGEGWTLKDCEDEAQRIKSTIKLHYRA